MIHFYSKNKRWCELIQSTFQHIPNITIENIDIRKLKKENSVFVSPSNSLIRMEGGIDRIISREIFPKIDKKCRKFVRSLAIVHQTNYILPVGSSIFVDVPNENSGLILSPTMYNSSNISHTKNPYISLLSSLLLFKRMNEYKEMNGEKVYERIYITGHGCGNGGMSLQRSIDQFYQAYQDFIENKIPKELSYINCKNIPIHTFILLEYEEEIKKYEIDENEVKTIRISKDYQLEY